MNLFFISRKHTAVVWRRHTGTFRRPIWICGWRQQDHLGGPDRNWVYEFSNTTTKNLRTTYNVLIAGCLESVNSWVWGNVKPTSTWSDNSSQWKIWTTHCGLWKTLSNSYGDKITHGWSMCSSLLDPQSLRRPTFSSSFSNATSVLDLFFLLL